MKINRFSKNEIIFIQESYPDRGCKYCAEILKRNPDTVQSKAASLGIKFTARIARPWKKSELNLLIKKYPKEGRKDLIKKLGRTFHDITKKVHELNLQYTGRNGWQDWQVSYLKKNYNKKPSKSISRTIGKTIPAMREKAKVLKIAGPSHHLWTRGEIGQLKKMYTKRSFTVPEIARKLGRSEATVISKANSMNWVRPRTFTKADNNFIRKNFDKMSYRQIAKALGRDLSSIHYHIRLMGYRRMEQKIWNEEETGYLLKNYHRMTAGEIAKKLKRTKSSVQSKAGLLFLKKR